MGTGLVSYRTFVILIFLMVLHIILMQYLQMLCREGIAVLSRQRQTLSDGSVVLMEPSLHSLGILVCQTYSVQFPAGTAFAFFLQPPFFTPFNLTILVINTSYIAFWFGGLCYLATLPLVKNVLVRIVQMHTSIGIPSRSFPCAVSIATGHYMERRSL